MAAPFPSRLTLLILAVLLGTVSLSGCSASSTGQTGNQGLQTTKGPSRETFSERELISGKSLSKSECQGMDNAVWVEHAMGSECVRYYPSDGLARGNDGQPPRLAVLFFPGDNLKGKIPLGKYGSQSPWSLTRPMQSHYRTYKVPYILVARPGTFGSSGDHKQRRRPKEFLTLNAAVDAIKARYGLEQVVLAGQSGGATSVAALLTLGRIDVKCAAASSGAFSIYELATIKRAKNGERPKPGYDVTGYNDAYNVIDHVDGIAKAPERILYFIGDPGDDNTVFPLQLKFIDKVKAAGHTVEVIEAEGKGPDRHSLGHVALKMAGICARQEQKAIQPAHKPEEGTEMEDMGE